MAYRTLLAAAAGLLLSGCSRSADLIIINGKVWTVNERQPVAEAVAVLSLIHI